jgi:hypothetical protein
VEITLYWKDAIIEKIWRKHGVIPDEVEEVIYEGKPIVWRISKNRFKFVGPTQVGRYLTIIMERELINGVVYVPLTALDSKAQDKKAYKKRSRPQAK